MGGLMKKIVLIGAIYGFLMISQSFAGRVVLIEWCQCWW